MKEDLKKVSWVLILVVIGFEIALMIHIYAIIEPIREYNHQYESGEKQHVKYCAYCGKELESEE